METVKRGYVPKDATEFGPKAAAKLNATTTCSRSASGWPWPG